MPTCQHVKACHKHAKGSCQCLFKQNNSTFKAKGTRAHVPAVYWSPWADVLPKFSIGNRSTLLQPVIAIASRDPAFALIETLESLLLARVSLTASGFAPLSWPELLAAPPSQVVDEFCFRAVLRELDHSAAVAARIFAARPTSPELSLAPSRISTLLQGLSPR